MPELYSLEIILSTFSYVVIHLFYPITVIVHPFIFSHKLVTPFDVFFLVDRCSPFLLALFFSTLRAYFIDLWTINLKRLLNLFHFISNTHSVICLSK